MNGYFQLKLTDGSVIPLRFCTWTLKRFLELQKVQLGEMAAKLDAGMDLSTIVNLITAAHEYVLRKKGDATQVNDVEVCDWIDDIGGIVSPQIQELIESFISTLTVGDKVATGTEAEPEEKKSESLF